MNKIKPGNKGVSTVFGSILFMILALTLSSTLFIALYEYNQTTQEAIILEENRKQEKIALVSLKTENKSGIEYVKAIVINNNGSITCHIRAVYVDNEFKCDPSDVHVNPDDTYINAKETREILLPPENIVYQPESRIVVATERGMKSTEYMWKLKNGNRPPSEHEKFYMGPLQLNFTLFYYANYSDYVATNGHPTWGDGWNVKKKAEVVWNITVTNIDDRAITLKQYSAFTLVPNVEGAQLPWYINLPRGSIRIEPNETISLVYIWTTPGGDTCQTVFAQVAGSAFTAKVFLTFMGVFHELDGTIKPYGQTIPFEAVLVSDVK